MNTLNFPERRWLAALALALGVATQLPAQQALYVEYKDKAHAVHKVHNGWVTIIVDGKPVEFIAKRSVLQPVEEYLPVLVAVKDVEVRSTGRTSSAGGSFNNDFRLNADFTSPTALNDVFLVLELNYEDVGQRIFFQEIGELKADTPHYIAVAVPLQEKLGAGKYRLHVLAGGREVFNTKQPEKYREAMLDKMVATRIAGVTQANPKPFVAPAPEYPAALRKAGPKGDTVVMIRISPRGVVLDPVVESATDPAFGEAALAAVRQWRFLPQVKEGHAVEARVSLPFAFSPPAAGKN